MNNPMVRRLLKGFAVEAMIYTVLVAVYFFVVLKPLAGPLETLSTSNLILYAFIALALVAAQGVALEYITGFLISRLGFDRME